MSVKVKINDRTFSIHDRFQDLITSLAVGEEIAIWDGPDRDGKHVKITSIARNTDDDLTISEYAFEGNDTNAQEDFNTQDVNDTALLFGLGEGNYKTVKDTLAYNYSHAPQNSLFKFEGSTYKLYTRHINIVNYGAPLGSGLSARLFFSKN